MPKNKGTRGFGRPKVGGIVKEPPKKTTRPLAVPVVRQHHVMLTVRIHHLMHHLVVAPHDRQEVTQDADRRR